jgi:uncharacterized protein
MILKVQGSGPDLKATVDFPTQGAKDIPVTKISQDGAKVHLEALPSPRQAVLDGEIQPAGTLAGDFQQAGYKGTFTLARVAAQPTAVVPYRQEAVKFKNGDISLGCTLSLPQGGGPFPAVVMITGSGAQNRDEDLFGFQPFRLIADDLTPAGIAVLRCDDRGVGESTGDVSQATSEDLAGDVLAAVQVLKARPDINPKQIGLIGHSEGGIIAPMVAAKSGDVAFVVMLAGTGVTGREVLLQQLTDIMKANQMSQADIDKALATQQRTIDAVLTGKGWDELKAEWQKEVRAKIDAMPADQRQALGDLDQATANAVKAQVDSVDNPWFKFFLTYDPAPALQEVKVPVLALFGGKDVQVSAAVNEPAVKAALAKGGNQRVTTKIFPEANHLFQAAGTGSPNEYATLPKEFLPGFLDTLRGWIQSTLK